MTLKSILIVVDKFPTTFGHSTYVKEVASKLQKMGFKVTIGAFAFTEEPPKNVVFVFATTELQKVPATVIGRCQTFYLQKISRDKISQRIKSILEKEKTFRDTNQQYEDKIYIKRTIDKMIIFCQNDAFIMVMKINLFKPSKY